ncbi:multicopper oxidase family protein [Sandaracinus amylolyticus]|uniref:multicopper oxidase family protein n=1 Tax=Sandaracinus amylolyticus TaxID=927083 RepID=UPI001F2E7328|nr:multicopper oxidase family protein [Sandaracinus amylolyticus]
MAHAPNARALVLAASCGALLVTGCRSDLATVPGAQSSRPRETGTTRSFDIVAAPTTLPLLDGRALDVWAYDGQVPGPVLRANVGDRLRVRITNRLPQPTSIHWHGIRLDNAMDGVPGVTQPPIAPGESFTYDFVARDAGTFWFHPHTRGSEQIERGLHGVLVIDDPDAPRVRDAVWVLDDWRLDASGAIDPAFVTRHDLAHDGRWGRAITINARIGHREPIAPGERLRVRIVNVANGRVFAPRVVGADARIIAFDGRPTDAPLTLDRLEIAPGNRVDLEVVAPAASGADVRVVDAYARNITLARFDVAGAAHEPDARAFATSTAPDWRGAMSLAPDLTYELGARRGGPYGLEWTLNGEAMREGAMGHAHDARDRVPLGRFVKMRFVSTSARLHPMHLHGQFFRVLARDGVAADEPHWRDTVLVHPRETVDIGLVAEDAGTWALHCHVLEHHDSGMMTLLEVM